MTLSASAGPLTPMPLRLTVTTEITYSWRHNVPVPVALADSPSQLADWLTQHEEGWVEDWDPDDADTAEHGACSLTVDAVEIRDPAVDPDRIPPTYAELHQQALTNTMYAAMQLLRAELPTLRMTELPHPSNRPGAADDDWEAVASWDGPVSGHVTITNGTRFCFETGHLDERLADQIADNADEVCDTERVWALNRKGVVEIGNLIVSEAAEVARILARHNATAA
ncbi:hypothetical protein ACFYOY_36240 [Streptomyces sp. NPDC007875]|uniref:hypothetical protein n=1 Tax=Streptomyces sp. NPDC007875 TaxID=3364783 RepID=UPI0036AB71CC